MKNTLKAAALPTLADLEREVVAVWELAHALHPENEAGAKAWVEPLLHQLRPGGNSHCLRRPPK